MRFRKNFLIMVAVAGLILMYPALSNSKQVINLTLDSAVEIAMGNSYRIKQLQLGIERNRLWLKARQASLKSKVFMDIVAPEFEAVSDYKWNSTLQKDEIVRENTRLWQMDLAIRQPVLIMGYPTNGYLSLNNKTYKYTQRDGYKDVNYYNRYYVKFEQPFFLPNELKNDIEEANLDLKEEELDYIRDRMYIVERVSDDYYDLFEYTYFNNIFNRQIENLQKIEKIAAALAEIDSTHAFDSMQIQMELTNTGEEQSKNLEDLRQQEAESKQNLRLSVEDSVYVVPKINFKSIDVNEDKAIEYGFTLNPRLSLLNIEKRMDEIDISNAKGSDAFNVTLEMTYGLEKQHERTQSMWEEYDKSYSTALNAYVPIWDWGRRKARIQAEEYGMQITEIQIEEQQSRIRSDIITAVDNLHQYQSRMQKMMISMNVVQNITDQSMEQYRLGNISLQDLLQIVARQKDTEMNFVQTYQGYQRSLISLMMHTFYDFENDIALIDKYRIEN